MSTYQLNPFQQNTLNPLGPIVSHVVVVLVVPDAVVLELPPLLEPLLPLLPVERPLVSAVEADDVVVDWLPLVEVVPLPEELPPLLLLPDVPPWPPSLVLAVVFIYMILASQFGSFIQPVAIMASLPLSLLGVAVALLAWRSTLNIFSMIGFIMLMGLVTKNAILLVDYINTLRHRDGMSIRDAVEIGGRTRLRPILMTSIATMLGLVPMAIGLGEGGELQAPLARVVIGGLLSSTLLTLLVVPVVYSLIDGLKSALSRGATPAAR